MRSWIGAAVCAVTLAAAAGPAQARRIGTAIRGCENCHRGGATPAVSLTADPAVLDGGGTVTLTLRIQRANGNAGGFYLTSNSQGVFSLVAGEPTRLGSNTEVVHNPPRTTSAGEIVFQTRWTAPAGTGSVDFDVWGMSANGDGRTTGDAAGYKRLSMTWGCTGRPAWHDFDGDGFGLKEEPTMACTFGNSFADNPDDCNDNNPKVNPAATEICNTYDDNCDGQINEGLGTMKVYVDRDGDGDGDWRDTIGSMCSAASGFAPNNSDCNDNDKSVHPGAEELCDNLDNDCNNKIDDGTVYCGVGWCRRKAESCIPGLCEPGRPRAEQCNYLDDDCNGVIDDPSPTLCPPGQKCSQGRCVEGAFYVDDDGGVLYPDEDGGAPEPGSGTKTLRHQASPFGCAVGLARANDLQGGDAGAFIAGMLALLGLGPGRRGRRPRGPRRGDGRCAGT